MNEKHLFQLQYVRQSSISDVRTGSVFLSSIDVTVLLTVVMTLTRNDVVFVQLSVKIDNKSAYRFMYQIPIKTALINLRFLKEKMMFMNIAHLYKSHILISDQLLCTDPFFQCLDGQCIVITNRCNGQPDCKDGTDELACGMSIQ